MPLSTILGEIARGIEKLRGLRTMSNFGYEDTASASAARPTRMRVWVVAILFICVVVAFLDRVNLSVLVANQQFLQDMGLVGKVTSIFFILMLC